MLYRRCVALIVMSLLFIVVIGPAAHALQLLPPAIAGPPLATSFPPAAIAVPWTEPSGPSISVYALLELAPLVLSLLLLLSLHLINRRHAHG